MRVTVTTVFPAFVSMLLFSTFMQYNRANAVSEYTASLPPRGEANMMDKASLRGGQFGAYSLTYVTSFLRLWRRS